MTLETVVGGGLLIGLLTYLGLAAFFIYGWIRRITGRAALASSAITAAWFAAFLLLGPTPVADFLEISAYAAWIVLLMRILGIGMDGAHAGSNRSHTVLALLAGAAYVGPC